MKAQNSVFRFVNAWVYSNFWVALSAVALAASTSLRYHLSFDLQLLAVLFLFTFSAYWFLRHPTGAPAVLPESAVVSYQLQHKKTLQLVAVLAGVVGLLLSLQLSKPVLFTLIVAVVLSLLYSSIVVKNAILDLGLRRIPGVKIVIIALTWTLVTFVIPLQQAAIWNLDQHWKGFAEVFCFVFAITLPFDIRDKGYDAGTVKTLPILFGTRVAKILGVLAVVASGLLAVLQWRQGVFGWQVLVPVWLVLEATTLFIWLTHSKRNDLFFSFGVESLPVVLFFLLFIFRYF
ncbi:MAG: UbiA family prenyltransferase [Schleiferiaceae bacterium]|nr:UbiA family prenyltransferase [Schleiferiaceae bacterium]